MCARVHYVDVGLPHARTIVVHRVCEGHMIVGCVSFHSDFNIKVTSFNVVFVSYFYTDVLTHASWIMPLSFACFPLFWRLCHYHVTCVCVCVCLSPGALPVTLQL